MPCRLLEWDSEHFGFPIAIVEDGKLDPELADAVEAWCAEERIRCLYFLADAADQESSRVAAERGFMVVDERIEMRHSLDPPPEAGDPPAGWRVREGTEADLEPLGALAGRSHHLSRFYFDGRFSTKRCDALYAAWVGRGVRDERCSLQVAELDGRPVGYELLGPPGEDGSARLDLLAIDETHRAEGTGSRLLCDVLGQVASSGAPAADTVLQQRNVPSLRVHEALGFLTEHIGVWHHRWFGEDETR